MEANILAELEELFDKVVQEKEFEKYTLALVDYLLFVEEVQPFNTISRKIEKSFEISRLYKELDKIIKDNNGRIPKVFSYSFCNIQRSRMALRIFHSGLVEKAKKQGLRNKDVVLLFDRKGDQRVYFLEDSSRCYSFRGKNTQRFKIINILFRTKTDKTIKDITRLLNKNENNKIITDNLKDEIKETNKNFKSNLKIKNNLIAINETGSKNLYSLNRNDFIFEKKK